MDKKGFTLVELLAVLVILGLVVGISIISINFDFENTKKSTEEIFVDTLKDAVDVYLSNKPEELKYTSECGNKIVKKHGNIKVYKATYSKSGVARNYSIFDDIINSSYYPISEADFVNPGNEDVACNKNAVINIYRDDDYIYYYSIDKNSLSCLKNIGDIDGDGTSDYSTVISNLPEGFSC